MEDWVIRREDYVVIDGCQLHLTPDRAEKLIRDMTTIIADIRRDQARELRTRLEAAEQVCVLLGWTSLGDGSEMSKAAEQAWHDWCAEYRHTESPGEWRERIAELARRRDEIRARTLAAIRNEVEP